MKLIVCIWLAAAACVQAAGLEFAELLKEVNAPEEAPTVTADFNFTNKSNKAITITSTDGGCPCLKVLISGGKLKYEPGESGVIRATFEVGSFAGVVDKELPIYLAGDLADKPSLRLTLRVHVPVLITVEPRTVKWEIGGKADPQTIQIRMAEGKTIRVTNVTTTSDKFRCELKTLEEGKKYDLVVTPLAMGDATLAAIRIETDCELKKFHLQQGYALIQKKPL